MLSCGIHRARCKVASSLVVHAMQHAQHTLWFNGRVLTEKELLRVIQEPQPGLELFRQSI